jgi:HK97 family phage portal protein
MSLLRRILGEQDQRAITGISGAHFDRVPFANSNIDSRGTMALTAAWGSVRLLADVVSGFPADAFVRSGGVRRPYRPGGQKPSWMTVPIPDEPGYTFNQLISECIVSLYTDGNSFLYCPVDENGEVLEVRAVDPRRVTIFREGREVKYRVQQGATTDFVVYGQDTMIHIPLLTMPGELRGINPVEQLRRTLGLATTIEESAASLFGSASMPSGIIEVPHDLTKDQAESLKAGWIRHHTGTNMYTPGVLTGGSKFVPTAFNPEDTQLLASRSFSTEEIARIFRVPPVLIGVTTPGAMSYSSVEQQNLAFTQYTLKPLCEVLERQLSNLLMPPEAFIRFNMDSILRGTPQSRAEVQRIGLQEGWSSVNDIRRQEDLPPIEGGDTYRMPLNEAAADMADLRVRSDIAGVLVRAGYDPIDAAKVAGISPIKHTGAAPVTVQPEVLP